MTGTRFIYTQWNNQKQYIKGKSMADADEIEKRLKHIKLQGKIADFERVEVGRVFNGHIEFVFKSPEQICT